ncbi:FtsX-like permease family protein [Actinomadura kijaniata]|uniref:FtsX-like permease family protein n=1 Tax=Actinomadura kijaniata TaxID=46161 RepID=UPI00083462BB|nr:ABC transporter permease [Actinomadura kijaniata]
MNTATLRIAWRDARRAKGRTALVALMIGLPVMMITAVAVLLPTAEWSLREELPHELGRADARISGVARQPVQQTGITEDGYSGGGQDDPAKPWSAEEIRRHVAARYGDGVRVTPVTDVGWHRVRTPRGARGVKVTEVDLRDPLTRGLFDVVAGRAPAAPGEIALGAAFAERGFRTGDTVSVDGGTAKRLVGFVRSPRFPGAPAAVAAPGTFGGPDTLTRWLIATGKPVTWKDVQALNAAGLTVLSRAVVTDPPDRLRPETADGRPGTEIAISAMAVAMIVLEVVLLAGPAFAVGLRRRRRELALVAAVGGHGGHLRAVVLAGGLVIGGVAALTGAATGIGLAAAVAWQSGNLKSEPFGPLEVPWLQVAATVALGAGSGLAAALAPALQAARMNVVAALAGRRDQARARRGWPILGGLLIGGGIALSLLGARIWLEFGAAFGAIAIIIGCVMIGPWVVGVTGRVAGALPLPLRLAVRDGARNRGRAAPAVAAIMAAVAGITVLAIGAASDFEQQRVEYQPRLPMGSTEIRIDPTREREVRRALEQELPGVPYVALRSLPTRDSGCGDGPGSAAPDNCPMVEFTLPGDGDGVMAPVYGVMVGGPREARTLLGRDVPEVAAALTAGKAVLFRSRIPADGKVAARVFRFEAEQDRTLRVIRNIPAVPGPGDPHVRALVPPRVAARFGLTPFTDRIGVHHADHVVTRDEQDRLTERLAGVTRETGERGMGVYVERGFDASNLVPMAILAAAAGVLVLGASLITTGLSAADARPDLATLAAIGARPRTRRLLMMGQAGFVAVLGCWLGVAAGIVPGIAVAWPLTNPANNGTAEGAPAHGTIVEIPWELLGAVGVLVPLTAALAAGLFTRSRLPVVRRMAS